MSRISDYNEKFLYTKTNPEGIIESPKGGWFFRSGPDFYVNTSGDMDGTWVKLQYKAVILPRVDTTKELFFEQEFELWFKNSDGFIDQFKIIHPKSDWKFYAYGINVFLPRVGRLFNWFFPVPTSTNDPVGIDGNRSYDENYFYAKISGKWYRTPIALYTVQTTDSGEIPYWYNNLPFVDAPRHAPRPAISSDSGLYGEQSYDNDFFYIKVSQWKRCQLLEFSSSKMTTF